MAKVPNSAGSAGNVTLKSADLSKMEPIAIEHLLRKRQHAADGPPISEGVFEQRTRDAVATFVYPTRSTLPQDVQTKLVTQATAIATLLQALGYFGRCSLDAVICVPPNGPQEIHWIECSGRWGGVSIPMTVATSLNGGVLPEGFTLVQEYRPDLPEMDTTKMLSRLDNLLLHARDAKKVWL